MRVIVMIKANPETEAGATPSEKMLADMTRYNEELVKAGVMLDGMGLHPSNRGAKVKCSPTGEITVQDGPFTEAKELIAGFWIWQVKSLDEAIEWAKRMPDPDKTGGEVEIRQIFEDDEFGDEFTPELREREAEMRRQIAEQQK